MIFANLSTREISKWERIFEKTKRINRDIDYVFTIFRNSKNDQSARRNSQARTTDAGNRGRFWRA
jgi:hypothetical protein